MKMSRSPFAFKNFARFALCLVMVSFLFACGGKSGSPGGPPSVSSGSGSGAGSQTKKVAGVLYGATESVTSGEIYGQNVYTDGTVGTATVVATYCAGNNDHDLTVDTSVAPGTTYVYILCRNSGTILGYAAGSSPSDSLTKVANISGVCCLAQVALSSNGKYMFVANSSTNTVAEYAVGANGSLTSIGTVLSFSGSYGVYSIAVSPSGSYLLLARADSSGTTYYMDEYAVDNTTGGLSQVGSDVTIGTLNTFGGLYPAQNTNNGDLLAYTTGQNGYQILIFKAGPSWDSGNIVSSFNSSGPNVQYGGAQFDSTGKVLYAGALSTGDCNGANSFEVVTFSIGLSGSSLSKVSGACGANSEVGGGSVSIDNTDGLFFSATGIWSISSTKAAFVATAAGGSFGQVFVP